MKRRDRNYERMIGGFQKLPGDSKFVTANRITIPPKFLTLDAISETARKNDNGTLNDLGAKENIYGIFESESLNLRRSDRINNKNNVTVSSNNSQGRPKLEHEQPKRKCKSLFKEINEKYSQIESQKSDKNMKSNGGSFDFIGKFSQNSSSNNSLFGHNSQEIQHDKDSKNVPKNKFFNIARPLVNYVNFKKSNINSDFCDSLENQLLDGEFDQQEVIESKKRIDEKIYLINDILRGRVMKFPKQKSNEFIDIDQDPLEISYNLYPQAEWVFKTPTRQRVCKPKLKKPNVIPAIVYRNDLNQATDIFELRPEDITIDLTKLDHENPQPCNQPFFAKSVGFFDQVTRNIETKQNCLFPSLESNSFAQNFEVNLSQQFNRSDSNLFNFQPSYTTRNLFNF